MTIAVLATIVFFLAIGINAFWPHRALVIAYGLAAILLGVLAVLGASAIHLS